MTNYLHYIIKTLVDYKNQLEFNNYVYKEQLLKGMAM